MVGYWGINPDGSPCESKSLPSKPGFHPIVNSPRHVFEHVSQPIAMLMTCNNPLFTGGLVCPTRLGAPVKVLPLEETYDLIRWYTLKCLFETPMWNGVTVRPFLKVLHPGCDEGVCTTIVGDYLNQDKLALGHYLTSLGADLPSIVMEVPELEPWFNCVLEAIKMNGNWTHLASTAQDLPIEFLCISPDMFWVQLTRSYSEYIQSEWLHEAIDAGIEVCGVQLQLAEIPEDTAQGASTEPTEVETAGAP